MGGFHVKYRKTNSGTLYAAISSKISLPLNCEGDSIIQAYPEFFHGFYYEKSHGIDTGIIYKDGVFATFSFAYEATVPPGNSPWKDGSILSGVKKGDTLTMNSFVRNGKMVTECLKNGLKVGSVETPLSTSATNTFTRYGATINREMTLAANTSQYAPSKAYFSDAKFSNSTLTKMDGTYVPLSNNNSFERTPYSDTLPVPSKFKYGGYSLMEGSFISDVGSADCRP